MTYTPCTTFANGLHPLAKAVTLPRPPRSKPPHKPRKDLTQYKLITKYQVTVYLRAYPGSTSVDLGRALGASKFNTCRMLKRLTLANTVSRWREPGNSIWHYTANAIAPIHSNYADLIRQCLAVHPGIPATEVLMRTGVTDIFAKMKRLTRRGEITAVVKMTPNYGKPLKHYSLTETA